MYFASNDSDVSGMAWCDCQTVEALVLLVREQLPEEDLTAVRSPTGKK